MKKRVIIFSILSSVLIILLFASNVSTIGTVMVDADYDVKIQEYQSSNTNVVSCSDANTEYGHIDFSIIQVVHTTGSGYNITFSVRELFDVTTKTEIRIFVDVTGSLLNLPQTPGEAIASSLYYTFFVQLESNGTSWNIARVFFNINDQFDGDYFFQAGNVANFHIENETLINDTSGFDPILSNWVIYGCAIDDDSNNQVFAYDQFGWLKFENYRKSLCSIGSGIPGYHVALLFIVTLGAAIFLILKMRKQFRSHS
jgi:hypothetical protein